MGYLASGCHGPQVAQRPQDSAAEPVLVASHDEATRWANQTLGQLSLKEKVGQMVCEQMRGGYVSQDNEDFVHWSKLVREYGIGAQVDVSG